jgi:hypothetical protein
MDNKTPMTIPELRVFLIDWFCDCGEPEVAAARLRDLLILYDARSPDTNKWKTVEAIVPDDGAHYLLLYALDYFKLIEHGSSIRHPWLSSTGKRVLAALQEHGVNIMDGEWCAHGYDLDGSCVECRSLKM